MAQQAQPKASITLKKWGAQAQEKASEIKDKAVQAKDKTLEYVDENPRKSALMAAGIGAAVGAVVALLFSRRR